MNRPDTLLPCLLISFRPYLFTTAVLVWEVT